MSVTPHKDNSNFEADNNSSWRILRIMSEFVDGFTFLANFQKSVTFFGSARLKEDDPYYNLARETGKRLAQEGYTIVTGGGPGIMQAGNQGAFEAGGNSVGLNIQLPMEQRTNRFVKQSISFHYFFSRKVMLDFSAEAYVFFPGGFGTLDEFFELVTLVQTGKIERGVPIILVATEFWEPLIRWMQDVMLNQLHTINAADLDLWSITNDVEEVVKLVTEGVQHQAERRIASKGRSNETPEEKLGKATRPMSKTEQ